MPVLRLSHRATCTPSSPIRKLAGLAEAALIAGKKIHYLNIGQPDLPAPDTFFEGLQLFKNKVVAYDPSAGSKALRSEWVNYLKRTTGLEVPQEELIVTIGASEALIFAFMTCCDPRDEIIIFDPTYANYIGFAAISGVNLVAVPSNLEDGFKLPSREAIEASFSNRTRAILLCNPNNPTGTVYSKEELQRLLDICEDNNIFLVVDETYRELVYDGIEPLSVLQLTPGNRRVIVIDSLSKRFSLCGARLGCMITANEEVRAAVFNIAQARLSAATIEQFAAAHMLANSGGDEIERTKAVYQSRRNSLLKGLSQIEDLELVIPSGAFYTIVRLPLGDAESFCRFMLAEYDCDGVTVFVAPAQGFFLDAERGASKVRVAFVINEDSLAEACEVLGSGLIKFREQTE
jgi:aspartate aminotransferase